MKCRPGDLALVTRAYTPGMLGRFVIVERWVTCGEQYGTLNGKPLIANNAAWLVKAANTGGTLPVLTKQGGTAHLPRRLFWDEGLLPIRPEPEPTNTTTEKEQPCPTSNA